MSNNQVWLKTHCGRMDHGGCALLLASQEDGSFRIKGDPDGYLNQGYVCSKGLAAGEKLKHRKRLCFPLKRRGSRGEGQWQRISWAEALDRISWNLDRIRRQHGARSVAFCQGMPKGLEHFVLIRLANLFGSPNVVAVQDVCHAPREISGLHTCGFYPVADYHHPSELVMLWGSNVLSTNEEGAICSQVFKQLKTGAKLIIVDPQRTELADRADLWLPLYPGTDAALALGLLRVIIEEGLYDQEFVRDWTQGFDDLAERVREYPLEGISRTTGVPVETIRNAAGLYAAAHPATLGWGNPIEHTVNAFSAARSLLCLMAICGNLDRPGGNIQAVEPAITTLGRFVRADLFQNKPKEMIHAHFKAIPRLMTVPPAHFRRAVLTQDPYPVRGAYIQCSNPMLTWADASQTYQAFQELDFIAVTDITMTPTTALADIVLPAATQFECDDIGHYGLGHGYILARPKLIDPPPECLPDMQILNELGRRLTPEEYWFDDHRELLNEVLRPSNLDYDQFIAQGMLKGTDRHRKYLNHGFKTPSGKVELALTRAEELGVSPLPEWRGLPEPRDPDFPLCLTSSKSPVYLHSSYRWLDSLRRKEPEPLVLIHPDTAAAYGIRDREMVVIETEQGRIFQRGRLTPRVLPGVVHASPGWWFPEEEEAALFAWDRANYNLLTRSDNIGREFGTPNLKGLNCRIQPASF